MHKNFVNQKLIPYRNQAAKYDSDI